MVIVIERLIQRIANGKWEKLEEIDKKYNELEKKIGFPPKKRYRYLMGNFDTSTIVIERQWESLALMEKVHTKSFLDPELQKLSSSLDDVIEEQRWELLIPHPPFPAK